MYNNYGEMRIHDDDTSNSMNLNGSAWVVSNPVHMYSIYDKSPLVGRLHLQYYIPVIMVLVLSPPTPLTDVHLTIHAPLHPAPTSLRDPTSSWNSINKIEIERDLHASKMAVLTSLAHLLL